MWFDLISGSLARCGPAFIKWGQWASTRSDMFPDKLCKALSDLHADAPAHSWDITQKTVETALSIPKGKLHDVFDEFDIEPIASGSIAQIHRATLHANAESQNNDRIVAVKVRHPNVSHLINLDFRIMALLADVIDHIPALSWLRIRSSVEQFSHTMATQAHLDVEAHHLEVLNHNFRHWKTVSFPKPIFATSSIIVETFHKGQICTRIMDEYDTLASQSNMKDKMGTENVLRGYELMPKSLSKFIVTNGLSIYLKMLIVDKIMHADLHPGNIMLDYKFYDYQSKYSSDCGKVESSLIGGSLEPITKYDVVEDSELPTSLDPLKRFLGHITMVDAGMVAKLSKTESINFIGLMAALGEGDGHAAAEAVLRFHSITPGVTDSYDGLNEEQKALFIEDMIILFSKRCRGYGTNVNVGDILRGVLGLVRKYHVRIDANYATLVVNALCMDGLASRACPEYNLLDAAKPLLQAHRHYISHGSSSKMSKVMMKVFSPLLYNKKAKFDNDFFQALKRPETCHVVRMQNGLS